MSDRARTAGRRGGWIAGLAIALAMGAVASAEDVGKAPSSTPRTAKFGGVTIGMTVAEASWLLEANGFRKSAKAQRRYIDDTGDVRRRIRYRELPGPDGALTIYELDETSWYTAAGFDPDRFQAEMRERFGEPTAVNEPNVGRVEMLYSEVSQAPTVIEVIGTCQAELQKKSPELSAEEAEKEASAAAQYNAVNTRVEKVCPGAVSSYRKMADALEAPRMTVVIRAGRVDTLVRWPWVEAELVRRLGRDKANRVLAFGVEALKEEEKAGDPK